MVPEHVCSAPLPPGGGLLGKGTEPPSLLVGGGLQTGFPYLAVGLRCQEALAAAKGKTLSAGARGAGLAAWSAPLSGATGGG